MTVTATDTLLVDLFPIRHRRLLLRHAVVCGATMWTFKSKGLSQVCMLLVDSCVNARMHKQQLALKSTGSRSRFTGIYSCLVVHRQCHQADLRTKAWSNAAQRTWRVMTIPGLQPHPVLCKTCNVMTFLLRTIICKPRALLARNCQRFRVPKMFRHCLDSIIQCEHGFLAMQNAVR